MIGYPSSAGVNNGCILKPQNNSCCTLLSRLNEIRVLKIKLADLRRGLHVLRTGVANVDVLKREVAGLGRALLAERTKVRALSEELENPLNVHR
jgi:hypothetical protein